MRDVYTPIPLLRGAYGAFMMPRSIKWEIQYSLMLEAIRKRTAGLVVKIFLGILILSFAVWGIGDTVSSFSKVTEVATVGNMEIPPEQLSNEMQRQMNRFSRSYGDQLDMEQARALGLVDITLGAIINNALFTLGADSLGVSISDAVVTDEIRKNPEFNGPLGSFDRIIFQQVLRNNSFSENDFIEKVRQNMKRGQFLGIVTSSGLAPLAMAEVLYRHRQEKRIAEIVLFTDSAMSGISAPREAELEKFHKDNAAQFTAPEYRDLTFITLTTGELAKEIAVPDDEIKQLYESRLNEFNTPERRQLQQIVAPDEETAKKAHKKLIDGDAFAKVAKEIVGLEAETLDIGLVTRDQILSELAGAAFDLPKNGFSKPIESPLGWHLLRVAKIEEGRQKTLDEARDKLSAELAKEKAVDSLFEMANQLEDELGGGATLEEAAKQMNLKVVKAEGVNSSGKNAEGKPVEVLPAANSFLKVAFDTPQNTDSQLTEAGSDAYFILRVDKVVPPTLKPLKTIMDEVKKAWKAVKRAEASKKAAEEALKLVQGGKNFTAFVAKKGLKIKQIAPFTRAMKNSPKNLPPMLAAELFTLKVGEYAVSRGPKGHYLARLKEIKEADPGADKEGVDKIRQELTDSIRNDLMTQLAGALRQRYPVTVNKRAVDQLF